MIPALLLSACLLAEQGAIRGTVLDAQSAEPLARVRVLVRTTGIVPSVPAFLALTDDQGRFAFPALPAGDYTLQVSTVGYRLLNKNFALAPGGVMDFEVVLSPDTFRQTDSVEVRAGPFDLERQDSPAQLTLEGNEAKNLASVLADDPLRAVQGLPGVTSNDDFESRFSLRGADYHRIGLYLDDILLHTPFHTLEGETGGSGSLTIFNGDMVDSLALHAGAWPPRFADRTGGVLDVHTREGSRAETSFRAAASASNAGVMAEGPLGRARRGAWMASARKSYSQYIVQRTVKNEPTLAFGFTDAQGKLTFDVAPRHQLSLSVVDGYSDLDRTRSLARLGSNAVMLARYHFTLANLGWRYSASDRFILNSRAAYMRERHRNVNRDHLELAAGHYAEWASTSTATWMWSQRHPLDFGLSLRRRRDDGFIYRYQFNPFAIRPLNLYRGHGVLAGGFAQQSFSAASGHIHFAAGLRWDHLDANHITTLSPHVSFVFQPTASTSLHFGWGQYAQFPDLESLFARYGSPHLLPERATHYVAAFEQRLGARSRVRLEAYQRLDRDLLFRPFFEPRLIRGRVFNPPTDPPLRNSQRGYARGFEIFWQRRTANRLTGWVSYALGYARLRDGEAAVSFPADFDQRHTVNVYAGYRIRPTVNLSVKWLYGSGFPIPGFYRRDDTRYFLSESRNAIRFDLYHRADLRLNKAFVFDRWKLTLYAEIINLFNHANYRFDSFNGYNARTLQASLSIDRLLPILPSAGLLFEF